MYLYIKSIVILKTYTDTTDSFNFLTMLVYYSHACRSASAGKVCPATGFLPSPEARGLQHRNLLRSIAISMSSQLSHSLHSSIDSH